METKPKIVYQIYRKRIPGERRKTIQYGVAFKFDTEVEREIFKENVKLCYAELIEKPKPKDETKAEPIEDEIPPVVEPEEKPKRRGRPPREDI